MHCDVLREVLRTVSGVQIPNGLSAVPAVMRRTRTERNRARLYRLRHQAWRVAYTEPDGTSLTHPEDQTFASFPRRRLRGDNSLFRRRSTGGGLIAR